MTLVPDIMALLYPSVELLEEAWLLAFQLRHAVYDCVFLALALRLNVRLVTADLKFLEKTWARFAGVVDVLA